MKKHTAHTVHHDAEWKQTTPRILKISRKFFPRGYHDLVKFPELRLCGKWLQDLGFKCGEELIIHTEANKITILAMPRPGTWFREDIEGEEVDSCLDGSGSY